MLINRYLSKNPGIKDGNHLVGLKRISNLIEDKILEAIKEQDKSSTALSALPSQILLLEPIGSSTAEFAHALYRALSAEISVKWVMPWAALKATSLAMKPPPMSISLPSPTTTKTIPMLLAKSFSKDSSIANISSYGEAIDEFINKCYKKYNRSIYKGGGYIYK